MVETQGLLGGYGGLRSSTSLTGLREALIEPRYHPDGNNFESLVSSAQVGYRLDWTNGASDTYG